jgi:hypothetical protein
MSIKNYAVSSSGDFDTLDEAVAYASRRAQKNTDTFRVYKAVKEVGPTTPNVIVTDVTV